MGVSSIGRCELLRHLLSCSPNEGARLFPLNCRGRHVHVGDHVVRVIHVVGQLSCPTTKLVRDDEVMYTSVTAQLFRFLGGCRDQDLARVIHAKLRYGSPRDRYFTFRVSVRCFCRFLRRGTFLVLIRVFRHFRRLRKVAVLLNDLGRHLRVFQRAESAVATSQVRRLAPSAAIKACSIACRVCVDSRRFTRINGVIRGTSANNRRKIYHVLNRLNEEGVRRSGTRIGRRREFVGLNRRFFDPFQLCTRCRAIQARGIVSDVAFFRRFQVEDRVRVCQLPSFLRFLPSDHFCFPNHARKRHALNRSRNMFLRVDAGHLNGFGRVARVNASIFVKEDTRDARRGVRVIRAALWENNRVGASDLCVARSRVFRSQFVGEGGALLRVDGLVHVCVCADCICTDFNGAYSNGGSCVPNSCGHCVRFVWFIDLAFSLRGCGGL